MLVKINQNAKDLTEGFGTSLGTENYYRAFPPYVVYTDGADSICKNLRCYWAIDVIASYQSLPDYQPERNYLQIWQIYAENGKATVYCNEKFVQDINYTDLPDGVLTFKGVWNSVSEYKNIFVICLLVED
jgi:hypothetical protein